MSTPMRLRQKWLRKLSYKFASDFITHVSIKDLTSLIKETSKFLSKCIILSLMAN